VGLLRKYFQILPTFSQNLILQKAFETVAPMTEELKKDGIPSCILQNIQTSGSWIFFIFSLKAENWKRK